MAGLCRVRPLEAPVGLTDQRPPDSSTAGEATSIPSTPILGVWYSRSGMTRSGTRRACTWHERSAVRSWGTRRAGSAGRQRRAGAHRRRLCLVVGPRSLCSGSRRAATASRGCSDRPDVRRRKRGHPQARLVSGPGGIARVALVERGRLDRRPASRAVDPALCDAAIPWPAGRDAGVRVVRGTAVQPSHAQPVVGEMGDRRCSGWVGGPYGGGRRCRPWRAP